MFTGVDCQQQTTHTNNTHRTIRACDRVCVRVREREGGGERERQRDRDRDRQTDRQTQTQTQTDRQTETERDRERQRQRETEIGQRTQHPHDISARGLMIMKCRRMKKRKTKTTVSAMRTMTITVLAASKLETNPRCRTEIPSCKPLSHKSAAFWRNVYSAVCLQALITLLPGVCCCFALSGGTHTHTHTHGFINPLWEIPVTIVFVTVTLIAIIM